MPQRLCVAELEGIDYWIDFPSCSASTLLPDAVFCKTGVPTRRLYTQVVPTLNGPRYRLPIIYGAVVQISPQRCYLTTSGDRELFPEDPFPISSCWLEACPQGTPGATSPTEWTKLLDRLEEIMQNCLGEDVALGEFTSRGRGEGNAGMLQVSWALYVKREFRADEVPLFMTRKRESRVDEMPFFTREGERIVAESLAEVPFGRPVHVLFYLWSYEDEVDDSAPKIAAAEYCFMQAL